MEFLSSARWPGSLRLRGGAPKNDVKVAAKMRAGGAGGLTLMLATAAEEEERPKS
jgi:hypothetical protein